MIICLGKKSLGIIYYRVTIFVANIGSGRLVGLAGSGVKFGVGMAHWKMQEWMIPLLGELFVAFINMVKRFSRSKFLKLRHAMNINLGFKNPDNCRWAILNRKNRLTHFLDMLRNTLVELSQK